MNDRLQDVIAAVHIEIHDIVLPSVGLFCRAVCLFAVAKNRVGAIGVGALKSDRLPEFQMGFCLAGRVFGFAGPKQATKEYAKEDDCRFGIS